MKRRCAEPKKIQHLQHEYLVCLKQTVDGSTENAFSVDNMDIPGGFARMRTPIPTFRVKIKALAEKKPAFQRHHDI